MLLLQVATDLLGAQVVTNELLDKGRECIRQLVILVSMGTGFALCHDWPSPVIGIQMTWGLPIPSEFSTDGRGMPAQGVGNILLGVPCSAGRPDVKPFFIA
jgi:hypothetical protein